MKVLLLLLLENRDAQRIFEKFQESSLDNRFTRKYSREFLFLKNLSYTYVKSYLSPHRECFFFLLIVTFGKFSAAYEALTDCAVCTPARVTTGVEDEIFKCFPLTGPVYTYQG